MNNSRSVGVQRNLNAGSDKLKVSNSFAPMQEFQSVSGVPLNLRIELSLPQ